MPHSPSQRVCAEGIYVTSGLVGAKYIENIETLMGRPSDVRVRALIQQSGNLDLNPDPAVNKLGKL